MKAKKRTTSFVILPCYTKERLLPAEELQQTFNRPMLRPLLLLVIFLLCGLFMAQAQESLTQSIKGVVFDADTHIPLPGANIILNDSTHFLGTTSNTNGFFILERVPIGRQSLTVSFLGYQPLVISDLIVRSGKEVIVEAALQELVVHVDEVQIIAQHRKDQPLNQLAMVSARSFTLDETNRYAGSYGDPARMVANYAGVMSSRDNRNDIVIRGNSPMGLQYRINGAEIPNPNHFGATATTGGPITMLNTNLMANSDFLTGAFPAEYGNALAGIFDIRLRAGNNSQREYWGQIGWNGLEFGAEGPFSKNSDASYLAAYRYSLIHLLEQAGIPLKESAQYQDISFHINLPNTTAGNFSMFGIGGTSAIKIKDSKNPVDKWTFKNHGEDIQTASALGTMGMSHQYFINKSTRIQSNLSIVASDIATTVDTFSVASPEHVTTAGENSTETKYTIATNLIKKMGSTDLISSGISFNFNQVNYIDSQYRHQNYQYQTNIKTHFALSQAYVQWQHKTKQDVVSYIGLHVLYLSLNGSSSLEPRAGIRWNINPSQSINLGAGLHSQMQSGVVYFVESPLANGEVALTNRNLALSKSMQFVLGYDYLLNEFLRLKAETYYQYLYDIPVKESIPQFSALNLGTEYFVDRQDSLVNKGTGHNYGIELTFERFMNKGFFYLFTASLFQSQYRGFDQQWRSTSFNGNYIFNGVGGYEIPLGKTAQRTLILGLRLTWAGGRPYVPFDPEATVAAGEVVYDWEHAYEVRHDDYYRGSIRVGMRRNMKRFSMEFVFDLQYRADYTYVYLYRIDVVTGEIIQDYNMGWYPNSAIRIMF